MQWPIKVLKLMYEGVGSDQGRARKKRTFETFEVIERATSKILR